MLEKTGYGREGYLSARRLRLIVKRDLLFKRKDVMERHCSSPPVFLVCFLCPGPFFDKRVISEKRLGEIKDKRQNKRGPQ